MLCEDGLKIDTFGFFVVFYALFWWLLDARVFGKEEVADWLAGLLFQFMYEAN